MEARIYARAPSGPKQRPVPPDAVRKLLGGDGSGWIAEESPQGILLRPMDAPPRKLYCEVTTDCNLQCRTCMRQSWDEPGGTMGRELFRRVVEEFRQFPSAETIQFGGFGEPLCHPHLLELVADAARAGLRTELLTNATQLTRSVAEGLLDAGLDTLIVSLDGASPSTHERVRRGSALEQVYDNLRHLHVLRLTRGVAKPEIGIAFVAMKSNISELPQLRRQSFHLGFSFIIVTNFVPHTEEMADEILYDDWLAGARQGPGSSIVPAISLPRLGNHPETVPTLVALSRSGAQIEMPGTELHRSAPYCRFVQEGRLAVRWDGAVAPCLPLLHSHTHYVRRMPKRVRAYSVGSLATRSLREIWSDSPYVAFRERVRAFDFAPCVDCGSCELRETNETDCCGDAFPRCGECLWAAGLVQCP